ncbi:MAG: hypothetical protein OXP66_07300 [Candidatus Tectomicrobia bacterium]|nr:hypothetical protein [Candidatus Tectomicrobia bacterium]
MGLPGPRLRVREDTAMPVSVLAGDELAAFCVRHAPDVVSG